MKGNGVPLDVATDAVRPRVYGSGNFGANAVDAGISPQPAAAAPVSREAQLARTIDSVIAPGTQVVDIADTNHFRSTDIYGTFTSQAFWDETKKNGKQNVLGIERYPTSTQPIFDAYFNKTISRDEFISTFDFGNNSGQTTADEDKKIVEGLADVMDRGVPVVALNNVAGLGGAAVMQADRDLTQLALERVQWFRGVSQEFDRDPKALALDMMQKGDEKMGAASAEQKAAYLESKTALLASIESGSPINKTDIYDLYDTMNPLYGHYLDHWKNRDAINIDMNTGVRTAHDDQVVEAIRNVVEQPNTRLYLLYGEGHAGGPHGMMAQFAQNGVSAELIVPYLGKDHFTCMKPDNADCMNTEKHQQGIKDFLDGQLSKTSYTEIPDMLNAPDKAVAHKQPILQPFSISPQS